MREFGKRLRCFVDHNSVHPWSRADRDAITRLHGLAREEKHRYLAGKLGRDPGRLPFQTGIQRLLWLVFSLSSAFRQFFRPERDMRRRWWHLPGDVSRMVYIALRFNLSPVHFYVYDLHRGPWPTASVERFFTGWEFHFLSRRMARVRHLDVARLDHKDRFAGFCREHNLPTLEVLNLADPSVLAGLKPQDLFTKATVAYGGESCRVVPYDPAQQFWKVENVACVAETLPRCLQETYGSKPFIVQYRVRNHPAMRWLSNEVLTTLRVVTAWNPEGAPVLLGAAIRFPRTAEAFLDNSTQGGVAAPVDPETGTISGPAIAWDEGFETDRPLGSERSFIGFQLPLWDTVKELLERAHRAAGEHNFLGWDVAITEHGVILNECNVWSDIELIQVPQKKPLLEGPMLECLVAECSQWPEWGR